MSEPESVWRDAWTSLGEQPWQGGVKTRHLGHGQILGATLHELPPHAAGSAYHFHHGNEEMLIVLSGRPTLRTPEGERQLEEGEVVIFRRGPDDAHKCSNQTDQPARYVMICNYATPDAVEYPDTRQLSVMAFTKSQFGKPLWDMRTMDDPEDSRK
ncbi:MAG: cupin domain-containing protein [Caulobacteraceae bacterium]